MPSTATDRLQGLTTSVAIKAPCAAVTTTAVTLSGEQTVGGVACVTGDRVLVAITGGSVNNGIWVVDTGAWSRAKDFDGARDVVTGTMVLVKPTLAAKFWQVTTSGAIVPGTTSITFAQVDPSALLADAGMVAFSYAVNYVVGTLGSAVKTFGIDPTQPPYNADPTGVADCSAALAAIWAESPGVPIQFPPGSFKVAAKVQFFSANNVSIFGPSARISGSGMGVTFIENAVANDAMWDFNADTLSPIEIGLGLQISDMTIRASGSIGTNTAIRVGNAYQVKLSQLHIYGGYIGIELVNGTVLDDGWNMLTIEDTRLENLTKWGVKANGSRSRNEGSYTTLRHVFFQACGTAETPCTWTADISGTTMTVSAVASGALVIGRRIVASGVDGDSIIEEQLTGSAGSTGTYRLSVDGAATSQTVTSRSMHDAPNSGAMIWKGQVLTIESSGAANGNRNVALYIPGAAGLANNVDIRGWTSENTYGRGFYCTGATNLRLRNIQVYNNDTFIGTVGVELEAANYVVREVDVDGAVIRATAGNNAYTAFKLSGANATKQSCRVRRVSWDNFDHAGQTRFSGFDFDTVAQNCQLYVVDTANLSFRPRQVAGCGHTTPLRLRGGGGGTPSTSGEWIAYEMPDAGRSITNSGLSNSTRYYCYLYDNGGTPELELSTTAAALDTDSGYMVKSGASTRLYVGSVMTDAGGLFLTSGTGWLNPEVVYPGASQPGAPYYQWRDSTGDLRVSNAAPTSDTDGTVVGTQT